MKVTKEVELDWKGGGRFYRKIRLPAGLRVKPIPFEPMRNEPMYWLDEFPTDLPKYYTSFPINSFERHDATHYGIRLNEEQVQEVEEYQKCVKPMR